MPDQRSVDPSFRPPPISFGAGKALLVLLAWVGGQILGGLAGAISAMIYLVSNGTEIVDAAAINEHFVALMTPALVTGTLVGVVAMIGATLALAGPLIRRADETGIGWARGPGRDLVIAAVVGVILSTIYVAGIVALDPSIPEEDLGPVGRLAEVSERVRWIWAFLAVAIAPLAEEFLFRGVLFSGLARSWGVPISAATVSALFLMFHLPETIGFWPSTVAVGALTIGTIAARLITNRLGPPIAMHLTYNTVLAIVLITSEIP